MKIFIVTTAEISADVLGDMGNRDLICMALDSGVPHATLEGAKEAVLREVETLTEELEQDLAGMGFDPDEEEITELEFEGGYFLESKALGMAWKIREMDLLD